MLEGMRLENFYTFKFCSPTRSSFLTARFPCHVNQANGGACPGCNGCDGGGMYIQSFACENLERAHGWWCTLIHWCYSHPHYDSSL